MLRGYLQIFMIIALVLAPVPVQAVESALLPLPGSMVNVSPVFRPARLVGIQVDARDPLLLNFLLDAGDAELSSEALTAESERLVKYFLAALTIPEHDLWVNLSPYEENRIIPRTFGRTEMGRDLLAQDYLLKQITTALLFPQDRTGEKFWKKIYALAQEKYGTTDIPLELINKVWIVPRKAVVYENAGAAYVAEARLEVILDRDYNAAGMDTASELSVMAVSVLREVVIPVLEKEVNEGRNFALLRQAYQSLILAAWYKIKMKQSVLAQEYADRGKTAGVSIADLQEPHAIWKQYAQGFLSGAYTHIAEDRDPFSGQLLPRKYFSGGFDLGVDAAMDIRPGDRAELVSALPDRVLVIRAAMQTVADDAQSVRPEDLPARWREMTSKKHLFVLRNGPEDQLLGVTGGKKRKVVELMMQAIGGGWLWQEKHKNKPILLSLKGGSVEVFVGERMKQHAKLTKRVQALFDEIRPLGKKQKAFIYVTDKEVLDLSDIHLGAGDAYDAFVGALPELLDLLRIAAEKRQVVVLNGDILQLDKNRHAEIYRAYKPFFEALASCDCEKIFYLPGNHDDEVVEALLAKRRRHLAQIARNHEITEDKKTRHLDKIIRAAGVQFEGKARLTRARLPYGPVMDKDRDIWFDESVLQMPRGDVLAYLRKMIAHLNDNVGGQILEMVNKDRKDRMVISRYVVIVRPAAGQILHFEHGHVPDKYNNKQAGGSVFDNFMSALSNRHWGDLTRVVENDLFYPSVMWMIRSFPEFHLSLVSPQEKRVRQVGELWDAILPFFYPDLFDNRPLDQWHRFVMHGHTHQHVSPGEGFLGDILADTSLWLHANSGTWSKCKGYGFTPKKRYYTWLTVDDEGVHVHEASMDASEQKGGIDLAQDRAGLQILTEGAGHSFVFDPVRAREIRSAAGLAPVIVDIRPANTTLFVFLGL